MSSDNLGARQIRQCLEAAAALIAAEEARLNALDSVIGDGDHGITMRVGFEAIKGKLAVLDGTAEIEKVLKEAGLAFMGATGGAIGPLLGGMLMAAGSALSGRSQMGAIEFKLLLESMETSLSQRGKAKVGDKTILDAVHASCQAVSQSSDQDTRVLCAKAAEAAELAAQTTENMRSGKGRSSRLGERVLGHPDPGAVSFALIMRAFANRLEDEPSA